MKSSVVLNVSAIKSHHWIPIYIAFVNKNAFAMCVTGAGQMKPGIWFLSLKIEFLFLVHNKDQM